MLNIHICLAVQTKKYFLYAKDVILGCGSGQRMLQTGWSILFNILHHKYPSIIAISCIHLPGLQTKLSVCKQRGEGGERVVTAPPEGIEHSCSRPKTVFIKHASSKGEYYYITDALSPSGP